MSRTSLALAVLCLFALTLLAPARFAAAPTSSAAPSDWQRRLRDSVAAREYSATSTERGLQAPNRTHGFRTYFGGETVRVHERTREEAPLVALTLLGVGRERELGSLAAGSVTSDGPRVEIRRRGLVEWYLNAEAGLEQGFTLSERPTGAGELRLEVDFGAATATANADGSLTLQAANGRSLRYGGLRADDADGKSLPARLELASAGRARIVVDDSLARYPIVVDPLLTGASDTTLGSGQSDAQFGFSISSAGDVNGDGYADLLVGAPYHDSGETDEGAAFIFLGGAAGIANASAPSAATTLQSNLENAFFAIDVASAGDVNGDGYADVVVGCPGCSGGRAYVFHGGPAGVASANPSTAASTLGGGTSLFAGGMVDSLGDVNGDGYDDVLVGALNGGLLLEAFYVWHGSGTGVPSGSVVTAARTYTATLPAGLSLSASAAGDVNGDGYDDLVIGNPNFSTAAFWHGGPAGLGPMEQPASFLRSFSQTDAAYGADVAGIGDVNGDGISDVAVSAPSYDFVQVDEGAVFIHLGRSGLGVQGGDPANFHFASLQSGIASYGFGADISAAGDVNGDGFGDLAVGKPGTGANGVTWVFLGGQSLRSGALSRAIVQIDGTGQTGAPGVPNQQLAGAGDVNGDGFDDLAIGAPTRTDTQAGEGLAYVYLGSGSGPKPLESVDFGFPGPEGMGPGDRLGASVATAGDLNADGFDDVMISAPGFDQGEPGEGVVFVFHGDANGINAEELSSATATIESNQPNAALGASLASAGDVNGDGYADLIVGAPKYNSPEADEGAAFLYLGSFLGVGLGVFLTPADAAARFESNQANALLGTSVAGLGDVNGDGFSDLAVGAPGWSNGEAGEGGVFVFRGSLAGIGNGSPLTATARLEGQRADSAFGQSLADAGDVDRDGFSDLIVAAPRYDEGQTDEGAVFVFRGGLAGIGDQSPATASSMIQGDRASQLFGESVSGAGDVNGDAYHDVIVGWPSYGNVAGQNLGRALLFHGGPTGIASGSAGAVANATIQTSALGSHAGASVAGLGDVNGDGFSDVAIGVPGGLPIGGLNLVLVLFGSATGVPSGSVSLGIPGSVVIDGPNPPGGFGASVAGADVNGDGFADLLAGAPNVPEPGEDFGKAYVFLGNRGGRGALTRQRHVPGGARLQAYGKTTELGAFTALLTGVHPRGRGRVSAQFEACPLGTPFGAPGCSFATLPSFSLANPSAVLSHSFSGLTQGALYRWRGRLLYAAETGALPPNPAHGPWKRLGAKRVEGDVRTGSDVDLDLVSDAVDNCALIANPGNPDAGGLGPASPADNVGDACQCGNVAGNGRIDATDVAAYRQYLANPTGAPIPTDRCTVLGRGAPCSVLQVTALRRALNAPALAPITSTAPAQVCSAAML